MDNIFYNLILQERTRYAKEKGEAYITRFPAELLKQYTGDSNTLIHFSDLMKLGINPRTSFETPAGIYGYPLTKILYQDILKAAKKEYGMYELSPFATDRKYVHVFRALGDKIHVLDEDGNSDKLSETDFRRIREYLQKRFGTEKWMKSANAYYQFRFGVNYDDDKVNKLPPFQMIYGPCFGLVDGNTSKYSKLLRDVGIEGVIDRGSGTIHGSEIFQGVIFSIENIQLLSSSLNPLRGMGREKKKKDYELTKKEKKDKEKEKKVGDILIRTEKEFKELSEKFHDIFEIITIGTRKAIKLTRTIFRGSRNDNKLSCYIPMTVQLFDEEAENEMIYSDIENVIELSLYEKEGKYEGFVLTFYWEITSDKSLVIVKQMIEKYPREMIQKVPINFYGSKKDWRPQLLNGMELFVREFEKQYKEFVKDLGIKFYFQDDEIYFLSLRKQ